MKRIWYPDKKGQITLFTDTLKEKAVNNRKIYLRFQYGFPNAHKGILVNILV